MRHFIVSALLLSGALLALPRARAASVTFDMATHGVGTFEGVDLPQTSLIRLGTFLISNAQIAGSFNNLPYLLSNFVEFGSSSIGTSYGVDAHANATLDANTSTLPGAGGTLEGDVIYLWIFNAPTPGEASQQGVFTSTNANWRFPAQASIPNTTTVDINEVIGSGIIIGSYGTGTSDAAGTDLYNLAHIPEPGALAALAACSANLLQRRRRRSP